MTKTDTRVLDQLRAMWLKYSASTRAFEADVKALVGHELVGQTLDVTRAIQEIVRETLDDIAAAKRT